ncbi:MAG TPA: PEGA domain-containing protein [Spirochaetota bacterium]|jgi:hypothetical protein|nr:MAG: PEGA domain protein [Spirochaetes bacterium ADurb.Bin133]HNZ25768.1 PEGA domain-containing protein [Spirochaetota bacterium]HPY87015.1 PEGA domain-containing protein [Spirochaetota bacterium]
MKKIYYLLFIAFLLSSNLFAQRSASTVYVKVVTNPSGIYFSTESDKVNKFGPTPVTIPLLRNRTYVFVFTKDGYQSKTISYKAGTGDLNVTLEPLAAPQINYNLSVSSNIAGADVYINNQPYGKTPLNVSLPSASYNVTVKLAGYTDFVSNVTLNSNQNINANFAPISYNLSVSSNISGADVYINNQPYGKTPLNVSLPSANYNVTVKLAGYTDFASNVTLNSNQNINANLTPSSYTLSVSSNIAGADVYINNKLYGKTPLNVSLQPAAYSVTVKSEGYLDYRTNINLTSNQNITAPLTAQKYIILSLPVGTKLWLNGKAYHLNWGNIKDDNKFDNVKTDTNDKREKYKEFKIYSETGRTDLIEIRYKNLITGPMNIEFNNKIKELRLSLFDK